MYFPILAAIWIDGHAFVIHIVYLQEICEPCYEENPLEKFTRKLPRKYHYVCREEGGGIPGDGWDDGGPDGSAAPR